MKKYRITVVFFLLLMISGCSKEKAKQVYEKINVFDNVTVEVSGIAPCAKAEVKLLEDVSWYDAADFSLSKSEKIQNGDEITVFCNIPEETFHANGCERILAEKTYLVPEFDQYVNDIQQLSAEALAEIVNEEMNQLKEDTESSQDRMLYRITGKSNYLFQYNKEWVEQAEVYRVILCTSMDYSESDSEKNIVYIILKVLAANSDYEEEGYFAFAYPNVVCAADGTLYTNSGNVSKEYITMSDYDELYKMLVEPKMDRYYVGETDGSGFESFESVK